jgi:hypothetical protein
MITIIKNSYFCSEVRTLVGLVKEGGLNSSLALPFFILINLYKVKNGV